MANALTFLGAVDTVTGSRYLVESGDRRVLVDCGLFQGPKKLRERNWARLPFEASSLDAVVLTHAHLDHAGFLPRLCREGFEGSVYCTHGTRDLLGLLLPDAGHLQEEEAHHANKWGYARHHPALPLFTRDDAERCLAQLVPIAFDEPFEPVNTIDARFSRAGHIVGSACVQLRVGPTRVAFSGDVGRPNDPLMRAPDPLSACDVLVVESTYGDRLHPTEDIADAVARVVTETVARGGVLVVPAFAVGRAQHLLVLLARLRQEGRIPACPIFLDSPMAIDATRIYRRHLRDHRLSERECEMMFSIAQRAQTADDSKAIDRASGPMIVISASGMCTGGRVLHHLRRFLPDENATILFVGFQAAGTRGRSLVDGVTELKLLGQYVPVRARVVKLDGLSAHGDHAEIVDWLRASKLAPREVFVTHGEPAASDAMRRHLSEAFGWRTRVPEAGETIALEAT